MNGIKTLALCLSIGALTACGGGKSNLTGVWVKSATERPSYVTISPVNKDGNVFQCFRENKSKKINDPAACTVENGEVYKVVNENKACATGPMGVGCIEYHSDSKLITIVSGSTFKKDE